MLRILYNSRDPQYKEPFGTVLPGENCTMRIKIPQSCQTKKVCVRLMQQDGTLLREEPMSLLEANPPYETWQCRFFLDQPGLYFYYFYITTANEAFRLLKQGEDTNMEDGNWWQLSCITEEAVYPDWAQGAVMYQIFPDRFYKSGECDLTGKLKPYTVHWDWGEEVSWQPTERGEVLNNDFFGGNFRGITEKLPYLASLGVDILYLNPISKAFSSHRYDTGDYKTPDPMLGTEEDFAELCSQAHALGIRVVLDGVYSHTGSDSLYFNKKGSFSGTGAYQSRESQFASWYQFRKWPDSYLSWWDFDTLPCLNKNDPNLIRYIIDDEDSVVAHWLKLGADGFRLDVADELPDSFILRLKKRIRELKPDALLIGEVWEDASNKTAYDVRRRYFVDGELDGVMNYPYRKAILDFARGEDDGRRLREAVLTIAENYPAGALHCSMTILGTHDTPRILTALVDNFDGPREVAANRFLTMAQKKEGKSRLLLAALLQFALPGTPSVYYGDEAGMEGHKDPFNRRTFPWGMGDQDLTAYYTALGRLRKEYPALRRGSIRFFEAGYGRVGFARKLAGEKTVEIYVNQSQSNWRVPGGTLLLGRNLALVGAEGMELLPGGFCLCCKEA